MEEITNEELIEETVPQTEETPVEPEVKKEEKKERKTVTRKSQPVVQVEGDSNNAKFLRAGNVITLNPNKTSSVDDEGFDHTWVELKNSLIKKTLLTGEIVSVEASNDGAFTYAMVRYKNFNVVIPIEEMGISNEEHRVQICNSMLGAEVDFIVSHLDQTRHAAVASRKDALAAKLRTYYKDPSRDNGMPLIHEGVIAEARVLSVHEGFMTLEVFGAELPVQPNKIRENWIADAREYYYVGQVILVKVTEVKISDTGVRINVERPYASKDYYHCKPGMSYLGTVTNCVDGRYFISLECGANAVAHVANGNVIATPDRGDRIRFACNRDNQQYHSAEGVITQIVKRAPRNIKRH